MTNVTTLLNATDVRKHWGQFNDDVVRDGPKFVKRNRDKWVALSSEHLKAAFSRFTFTARFLQEEDGTITATLDNFDIVENGDNEEEVLDLVVDELIEYANEYQINFNLYFNSPNRRDQFPYILNVLAQNSSEEVRGLVSCQAGEK
ncbi:hypothetical protein JNUCC1_01667 [Lentibacillus sp. JNUCC-1]|uniref:hypothetical protein n=1 Tax=Lentibacillus sp. JNUCC-1 TaxID=2654513 RepID=UPI0012E805D3|nr:hypothetical protein [Lentibacillus sp. JNUCC-1]MUV37861.1 hypothetical protein [Lentibacillus sp. JNUCC-1]